MISSICIYNYGEIVHTDDWNFKIPGSIFWRIYIVEEGNAQVRIGETVHLLRPGHAYAIPALTTHEDILKGTFRHKYLHFRVEDSEMEDTLGAYELPFEIPVNDTLERAMNVIASVCTDFALETSIPQEYEKKSGYIYCTKRFEGLPLAIKLELQACVTVILAQFVKYARPRQVCAHTEMLRVRNYIRANFARNISVESMAEMMGMRPESFIRAFKKAFRVSPHSYLLEWRINEAKNLLLMSTLSIKEISVKVGFPNPAYFGMLFRRYTSMTPGEYRRRQV